MNQSPEQREWIERFDGRIKPWLVSSELAKKYPILREGELLWHPDNIREFIIEVEDAAYIRGYNDGYEKDAEELRETRNSTLQEVEGVIEELREKTPVDTQELTGTVAYHYALNRVVSNLATLKNKE